MDMSQYEEVQDFLLDDLGEMLCQVTDAEFRSRQKFGWLDS